MLPVIGNILFKITAALSTINSKKGLSLCIQPIYKGLTTALEA